MSFRFPVNSTASSMLAFSLPAPTPTTEPAPQWDSNIHSGLRSDGTFTEGTLFIGDSLTNPLSPLFTYMPVAIGFVRKYNKEAGIGTVIANMIPYSATFFVIWLIQLIVWVTLNLPLGPGGGIYLYEGRIEMTGGSLSDNTSDDGGGGIMITKGTT